MNRRNFLNSWPFGLILTGLFFLTHCLGLGENDFWIDEYITWAAAHFPFGYMIQERFANGHMPTYFMLVRLWCEGIVGWSIDSVRIISVIFASLAFLGFFALVRRYIRQPAVRYAALALFFFHPFVLWASQEARMYAAVLCCSILATLAFLRFLRTGKWYDLLLYLLAIAAGISLHLLFALQFAPQFCYVALYHRRRLVPIFVALGAVGIGILLLFAEVNPKTESQKRKEFIYLPGAWNVVHATAELAVGRSDSELFEQKAIKDNEERNYLIFVCLFSVFLFNAWQGLQDMKDRATTNDDADDEDARHEFEFWRYVFFWLGVQFVLLVFIGLFFSRGLGQIRYHTGSLAPVVLILGLGFAHAWQNWGMHCARVALVSIMLIMNHRHINWEGPGVRDVLETISKDAKPDDGIIYCHNGALIQAFDVYDLKQYQILGIGKNLLSESVLLDQIEAFAKDKKRIWLMLYRIKSSPLDVLLRDRPEEYKKLKRKKIREVEYQLYEVQSSIHSSTATLSTSLGLTFGYDRLGVINPES